MKIMLPRILLLFCSIWHCLFCSKAYPPYSYGPIAVPEDYPDRVPGNCGDPFQFDCGNGICIPFRLVRNCVDDCGNNADEECGLDKVLCDLDVDNGCGYCVSPDRVFTDCQDRKYYPYCQMGAYTRRNVPIFRCVTTANCVPFEWLNDGHNDCGDFSDEDPCLDGFFCFTKAVTFNQEFTLCECVNRYSSRGKAWIKPDPLLYQIPGNCPGKQLKFDCGDGLCIDISRFRNCIIDCPNGSDEECWLGTMHGPDGCSCIVYNNIFLPGTILPPLPEPIIPEPIIPEPIFPEPIFPEPIFPEPIFPEPIIPEPEPIIPEPIIPILPLPPPLPPPIFPPIYPPLPLPGPGPVIPPYPEEGGDVIIVVPATPPPPILPPLPIYPFVPLVDDICIGEVCPPPSQIIILSSPENAKSSAFNASEKLFKDAPKDCSDWHRRLKQMKRPLKDGIYNVSKSVCKKDELCVRQLLCDMNSVGGGWTVIQKRHNGRVSFQRPWDAYRDGFGSYEHEFWLGNDILNELTSSPKKAYELLIEMVSDNGTVSTVRYDKFKVDNEKQFYALRLGKMTKGECDNLNDSRDAPFGTFDRQRSPSSSVSCGAWFRSGWWYNKQCTATGNLNVPFRPVAKSPHLKGIEWAISRSDGKSTPLAKTKMMIRQI